MDFTIESMEKALLVFVEGYKATGVLESIKRNNHMNAYTGQEFDEETALAQLNKFVLYCSPNMKLNNPSMTDILSTLSKTISIFKIEVPCNLPVEVIDAVLVDYVNYVGSTNGVDYGMYTIDIDPREEKTAESKSQSAVF